MQPPTGPVAFTVLGWNVYWYGIFIVTGLMVAAWVAGKEAERRGMDPDHVWGALILVLIFGLIGARIYHVLTPPPSMAAPPPQGLGLTTQYYLTHPLDLINVRQGGLGIPGAIVGGLFGAWLYFTFEMFVFSGGYIFHIQRRRPPLNFWEWADLGAMVLPLGHAIGRWGNFFNQELYGGPTTLPWGLKIDCLHRVPPYTCDNPAYAEGQVLFHPLFLYEAIWNLLTFGLLFYLARRYRERLLKGELLNLYLIFYPLGRFLLDFVRLDSAMLDGTGLSVNQVVTALVALVAAAILIIRRRRLAQQTIGHEQQTMSSVQ